MLQNRSNVVKLGSLFINQKHSQNYKFTELKISHAI